MSSFFTLLKIAALPLYCWAKKMLEAEFSEYLQCDGFKTLKFKIKKEKEKTNKK